MRNMFARYAARMLNDTCILEKPGEISEITQLPIGESKKYEIKCYRLDRTVFNNDGTHYSIPNAGPYIVLAKENIQEMADKIDGQVVQSINDYKPAGDSRVGISSEAIYKEIYTYKPNGINS